MYIILNNSISQKIKHTIFRQFIKNQTIQCISTIRIEEGFMARANSNIKTLTTKMSILQWMAIRTTTNTNNNNTNSTNNSRNSIAILSSMLGYSKIRAIINNSNNIIISNNSSNSISSLYINNHNNRGSTRLLHKLINKFL